LGLGVGEFPPPQMGTPKLGHGRVEPQPTARSQIMPVETGEWASTTKYAVSLLVADPVFASPLPTEGPGYGYSMRSSRRIGNLWAALGKNSRSKSPPASVAIEIKKVLATTAAVMLGRAYTAFVRKTSGATFW
jgi:hypothetical protein